MNDTLDVDTCPGSPSEDDLSSRLDPIVSIYDHLHADKEKLRADVLWDKGRPGDSTRPLRYRLCDILPQARFWATLLALDIDRLRALHDDELNGESCNFRTFLGVIPEFVWWFTRVPPERSENTTDIRSNTCCITGQDDAEECHIIPLWTLKRPWKTEFLVGNLRGILSTETRYKLMYEVVYELPKLPVMNTLCLSRQLQNIWQSGAFALEPVGYVTRRKKMKEDGDASCQSSSRSAGSFMAAAFRRSMSRFTKLGNSPEATPSIEGENQISRQESRLEYAVAQKLISRPCSREQDDKDPINEYGLQLRFQWLPVTSIQHLRADGPDLRTDPRTIFKPLKERDQKFGGNNAEPIKDGQIFTVWADNIEDLPNWDFLQLRSLACRIHRLGGGADPSLYEPPRPETDVIGDVSMLHMKFGEKCKLEKRLAHLYKELGGDKDVLGMDPTKCHFCGADSDPASR